MDIQQVRNRPFLPQVLQRPSRFHLVYSAARDWSQGVNQALLNWKSFPKIMANGLPCFISTYIEHTNSPTLLHVLWFGSCFPCSELLSVDQATRLDMWHASFPFSLCNQLLPSNSFCQYHLRIRTNARCGQIL